MSYILDALKKAEAQRKLGAVPGIHAPATYAARTDHRSGRKLWLAGALATLAAMLAALAWLQPWQVPDSAALPVMSDLAQVAPARLPPAPVKPKATVRIAKQAKPVKPRSAASRAPQPAQVDQPAAVQAAERQEHEPLTLRELPEQMQREIPALSIGGYIYSNNPAERSLLINNKLLREGDEVTPGLTLEKMMRGSVVLVYKGTRYRMSY